MSQVVERERTVHSLTKQRVANGMMHHAINGWDLSVRRVWIQMKEVHLLVDLHQHLQHLQYLTSQVSNILVNEQQTRTPVPITLLSVWASQSSLKTTIYLKTVVFLDCSRTAQYTVSQNGNKYMRCNQKKNYDGAKAFCEQDNAHLVTISSEEEQNLVKDLPG